MHLHTYELGDALLPTTANEGAPGHTHKTILPDGTTVETSPPTPEGAVAHVHSVDVRGQLLSTSDAVRPADYIAAAAKAMQKAHKRAFVARTALALTRWVGSTRVLSIANKPPYMIAPGAPRMWVDAVMEGQLAGYPTEDGEGIEITEQMIDEMIRNLQASPNPVPVDGAGVSVVHGTVDDTATRAAAWAYDGRKVLGEDGVPHMHLYLELRPKVHAEMKAGGYKYGSIAFSEEAIDGETNQPIGALLDSYAITNKPFQRGLAPHLVLSEPQPSADAKRVRLSQPREVRTMSDDTRSLAQINQVQKALLGVFDIPEDTPPNELGELVLMKAVEWKAKAGIDNAPTPPAPAPKLAEGDALEPAVEGAIGDQLVGMLMEAFALPEGSPPEALLELLAANLDAIKAAVMGAGEAPADAGPGGQEPPPAPTLSAEGEARVIALEASLAALTVKLNAEKGTRDKAEGEAYAVEAFKIRGLKLEGDAKATMVKVFLAEGSKGIDNALKGIKPVPPQGRALSAPDPKAGGTGDQKSIIAGIEQELAPTMPDATAKTITRAAIRLAAQRHPDFESRG